MADSIAQLFADRADDLVAGLWFEDAFWSWSAVVAQCAARATFLRKVIAVHAHQVSSERVHVGVLLPNVPEFVFLLGAAALSGDVIVGLNPTRRGDELARDVRHTDCRVVFTDAESAPLLDGLDLGCEVRLIENQKYEPGARPDELPSPESLYMLIFTSGSTGAPKAVQMTQGRAARTAASGAVAFAPDDVLYCSMPLFHGNALLANLFPALTSGASVVLRRRFSASEFLPDVRRYNCTYFNYVGRALSYIIAQPETTEDADNSLKWCLGSEASPADRKEFRRRFGCFVVEGYSSSEGGVVIQPVSGMPKGALGRPAEGVDVVVLDPATDAECPRAVFDDHGVLLNPTEAIGEIVGRDGLSSFEGYYNNAEATEERGRNGWYWTGDLGYRDTDGTFFFAGRSSDWLRVDGENFAAGPVENVIARFDGVRGVVVYPVPDPDTGDLPMAAIECTGAFDPDAFDRFLSVQADMGTKWTPRFVRVVEAIPLTATGKVDRKPLRAQRWDTDDTVWWKPSAKQPYRLMTHDDVAALRTEFEAAGRRGALA